MSFYGGAEIDLPDEGSGLDTSDIGRAQSTGAAKLDAGFFDTLFSSTTLDDLKAPFSSAANWYERNELHSQSVAQSQWGDPTSNPTNAPIDPKEWQKKYPDLGLTFTPDMGNAEAQFLVDKRQDELRRQYNLNALPDSWQVNSARGLGTLAGNVLDPINVAAAFVPVVGEARAALWAEKYGPTVGRFLKGTVDAAAGNTALQPFEYAEAKAKEDYFGPMDAFMNVAFGTVLGGGLHVGAGKLSDLLGHAASETREGALRASVAQMAEGRDVDVSPVLQTDPMFQTDGPEAKSVIDAADRVVQARSALDDGQARLSAASDALNAAQTGAKSRGLIERTGLGAQGIDDETIGRLNDIQSELGTVIPAKRRADILGQRDLIRGSLSESNPELGQLFDQHDAAQAAVSDALKEHAAASRNLNSTLDAVGQTSKRFAGIATKAEGSVVTAAREAKRAGIEIPEISQRAKSQRMAARIALQTGDTDGIPADALAAEARTVATSAQQDGIAAAQDGITQARQRSMDFAQNRDPSSIEPSDEAIARVNDEVSAKLGDDPETELQDATARIAEYKAQGIISDAEDAALKEANAADAEAVKTNSDAARAAARCLFLHP